MSTLHQQQIDRVIEQFESQASEPTVDVPNVWLYEFSGTSTFIRFLPETNDGIHWHSRVWTANKEARIQDVRPIIHSLLSNGYSYTFKKFFRRGNVDNFTVEYDHAWTAFENQTSTNGHRVLPLAHVLAMYHKNGSIRMYPMYQLDGPSVPDESSKRAE